MNSPRLQTAHAGGMIFILISATYPENEVDGPMLLELVNDIYEFQLLVKQAGVCLKIKALVRKV